MSRKFKLDRAIYVVFGVSGCLLGAVAHVPAATPTRVADHVARLQFATAPAAAEHVLAVQKQLAASTKKGGPASERDMVITGQIGGMPNVWPDTHPGFPWYAGQASFFLVDSKVATQFASHAKQHGGNHNCAFCRGLAAKNARAIAIVNLVDEKGEVIRTDVRELLDMREGQTVVVRGAAKLLGGSLLVIDATKIHVKR